jgi:hypothetical protein
MDKPITVSFRWSAKEMLLAQRLHMRYSRQGRTYRRIFIGGGVLFAILGIACRARGQDYFASGFPMFLLAAVFLAMPLFARRAVLKMYAQMPERDMLVTYEISTDRIATRSEVASTDMLWRTIVQARKVPEGFLLYPTDRMFHWLPVHGFHEAADVERLAQLTKANVEQYHFAS